MPPPPSPAVARAPAGEAQVLHREDRPVEEVRTALPWPHRPRHHHSLRPSSAMSAVLTHCVLTARFVPHLSPPLPSPSSPTPRLLPHHCCAMAGSCWLRGGDQATGKSSLGVWRSPASHPHRAPLPTTAPPSAPPPLPPPPVPPPSPLMPFPVPPHRAGRHSDRCHLHPHQSRPRSPQLALPLSDCA